MVTYFGFHSKNTIFSVLHVFLGIENKLQVAELTLQASAHAQLVSEETVDINRLHVFVHVSAVTCTISCT